MKTRTLLLAAAAALLLTACIPSVNPFYTDNDVVFEAPLLGEWQAVDVRKQPGNWNFKHARNSHYDLTVTDDKGRQGKFRATLFKLDDQLFLDLVPAECKYATSQNELVAFSMFPGHLLVHVAQIEPELRMSFCDFDWLEDYLKENPKALAHTVEDNRILLTAGTRDLQRFVIEHLKDGILFNDYGILRKQVSTQAAEGAAPSGN